MLCNNENKARFSCLFSLICSDISYHWDDQNTGKMLMKDRMPKKPKETQANQAGKAYNHIVKVHNNFL